MWLLERSMGRSVLVKVEVQGGVSGVLCVQNGCRWCTQEQWLRLGWPLESCEEVFGETWPVHPS